jgi:hypothetical protein
VWLEVQGADIGGGLGIGAKGLRAFFVEASGQAGEAFLAEEHAESVDADGVPSLGQIVLDIVDGPVAFAHGDDEFADRIAGGGIAGSAPDGLEETALLAGIVTELVAEHAKRAGRIPEAMCDFVGGKPFDEVGTQGFVLAMAGVIGGEKEPGLGR